MLTGMLCREKREWYGYPSWALQEHIGYRMEVRKIYLLLAGKRGTPQY